MQIINFVDALKKKCKSLPLLTIPAFLLAGAMLVGYLKHISSLYLVQLSLGSSGGLISIAISFGFISAMLLHVLFFMPICFGHLGYLAINSKSFNITNNNKLQTLIWMSVTIFAPISLFILCEFFDNQYIIFTSLFAIIIANSYIFIKYFLSYKQSNSTSSKPSKEIFLTAIATTSLGQILLVLPLIFIWSIASQNAHTSTEELLKIILWWIAYSLASSLIIQETIKQDKSTTQTPLHLSAPIIVTITTIYFAMLITSPYWFLNGALRSIGVIDNQLNWYSVDTKILHQYHHQISTWPKNQISSETNNTSTNNSRTSDISYLKAMSIFRFSSVTVLCPENTTQDQNTPNKCITFSSSDIRFIGPDL